LPEQDLSLKFRELRSVQGWLTYYDFCAIKALLNYQNSNSIYGNLFEIGAYHGKTSILLGKHLKRGERVYLCDVFNLELEPNNLKENIESYPQSSLDFLLSNLMYFKIEDFKLLNIDSSKLNASNFSEKMRLIHIDGSHLYNFINKDLKFAKQVLDQDYGILVVDDYRSPHTIGVTIAIWEEILCRSNFIPILISPAKMYLVPINSKIKIESIIQILENYKLNLDRHIESNFDILRIIGPNDLELYRNGIAKSDFLPPILKLIFNKFFKNPKKFHVL
jgi:hypothetical protein